MSYFTLYWKNDTWSRKAEEASAGRPTLEYAASCQFKRAGVKPGSTVFVVTVLEGILYVAGLVKVNQVLSSKHEVAAALGIPEAELWDSDYYVIPKSGTVDLFRGNVTVSPSVAAGLQFESRTGVVSSPKTGPSGKLDVQTLRAVRRLARGSEQALLTAIGR